MLFTRICAWTIRVYTWFTHSTCVICVKDLHFIDIRFEKMLRLFETRPSASAGEPVSRSIRKDNMASGGGLFAAAGGVFIQNSKYLSITERRGGEMC